MQVFYVGYSWIMINNLTKQCNFEIVKISITRTYFTKLYKILSSVKLGL